MIARQNYQETDVKFLYKVQKNAVNVKSYFLKKSTNVRRTTTAMDLKKKYIGERFCRVLIGGGNCYRGGKVRVKIVRVYDICDKLIDSYDT